MVDVAGTRVHGARACRAPRALAWGLLLALGMGACKVEDDVVATVEALVDGGTIIVDAPDAGTADSPGMMAGAGAAAGADAGAEMDGLEAITDSCDGGWLYAQLLLVEKDCTIPDESFTAQLFTTLTLIVIGSAPVDSAETQAPSACDFRAFSITYTDPTMPMRQILCPAYCEGLKQWLANNGPPPECLAP